METIDILRSAVDRKVSDIMFITGAPVAFKQNGRIERADTDKLMPDTSFKLVEGVYELAGNRDMTKLLETGDDDFSFSVPSLSRFRVNAFRQRGSLAAVIRVVSFDMPSFNSLGIPESVMSFASVTKGMVLVTGPAGSGKSTTLACLINQMNHNRSGHIITIEDPIEFLHRHDKCMVTQRELSSDTVSYNAALRAVLRQAPDVILLGEMRDYDTIKTAITAAETGHLLISTLHTIGASNTIDRIIDSFPPGQHEQIRTQLSMALQGVVSQQLVPAKGGGVIPAFEVMKVNNAISNLIRESKAHQIDSVIFSSTAEGMISMDSYLINLVREDKITEETAINYTSNRDQMAKRLQAIR